MLVLALVFGLVACRETANLDPELIDVEPNVVSNREETTVTINGRNLYRSIEVDLAGEAPPSIHDDFRFSIDGTLMPANRMLAVDSRSMQIVIPAGLELGLHSIEVTIPDGRRAELPGAFTVADCIGSECQVDCGNGVCAGQESPASCPADCQWWDSNWNYRMRLGFDHLDGIEDLDDFPVLVVMDPTMVDYSVMQSGGEDLRFVDEDLGTELPYEIELWAPNALSYVWVKVPKITKESNQDHIWMYYGNNTASAGSDVAEVWTESYESVWHLAETTPANFRDSSGNGNDLSPAGGINSSQLVDGLVAGSVRLDGNDDYLVGNTTPTLDITGDMTLMAWVNPETWNTIFPRIIHYDSPAVKYVFGLVGEQAFSTEERCWWAGRDNVDANALHDTVSLNTWTHLAAVFDSSAASWSLYQDGVEVGYVDADDIQSDTEQLSVGVRYEDTGAVFHLDARLDEVRIISAQRNLTWIHAQHHTMMDTFLIYGSEEALLR